MFADEKALIYDSPDLPTSVNRAHDNLVVVSSHLDTIGLTLNPSKTKCMHLHSSCPKVPF